MISVKAIIVFFRTIFIIIVGILPFGIAAEKPKMAIQFLIPRTADSTGYLGTVMSEYVAMKHRHNRYSLNASIHFMDSMSPDEILRVFCDDIVPYHVNTIVYIRRTDSSLESSSSDYIFNIAAQLGYPVIAWDPYYVGTLENRAESRELHIGPTLHHQCQAMIDILHRYNWTDVSIVTDTSTGYLEFISSIKQLVKLNNMEKGHWKRPELHVLSTTSINFDPLYTEDKKTKTIRNGMARIHKDTRVFLLHGGSYETMDILDQAEILNVTGTKYMWILSASSVSLSFMGHASRSIPLGTIGLHYNESVQRVNDVIHTSMTLWENSLNAFTSSLGKRVNMSYAPATGTCSKHVKAAFWEAGKTLYQKMKTARIRPALLGMPLDFDGHGVNKLVDLKFLNVQEKAGKYYTSKKWIEVGRWIPQKKGSQQQMGIEMDDITWPGDAAIPPKGKPERPHLSIATLKEEPYIIYSNPDPLTNMCSHIAVPCRLQADAENMNVSTNGTVMRCCVGLCVDLLKILSERIGFDFDLFEVPDREWGLQNENTKEWNGLIRILVDQKADMVMTSLKITKERNAYINFSVPFLETGITIVVSIRKGAISPTAFLEPYDYPAWCLILVFSVHATGASIFIFEWLSPSGLNQGKTSMREHKFSLFRSFWLIWAMLFGASVSADNPRGVSSRFLANVWALFALVFLASYTANLAAFMITKEEYYDLSGIEDWRLRQPYSLKPPFRYATVPNGSTEENMKKNYHEMYLYMKKFNQASVDEGIKSLKKQKIHAFIYDATVLEYRVGKDNECDLITVGSWYAETGYGVGFPKGSPYIKKVNKILMELQEYGELERLQKFWLAGACHRKEKTGKSSHHIGILNFTSAFILLAGGMVLGAILLALEHFYFKFGRTCLRRYDKRGCCALVSLSMGKSLTFEQSVLEAIDFHKKHRCKDPLCETQLWKVKHELDLALIRVDKLKGELAKYRSKVEGAIKPNDNQIKPNGFRRASRNNSEEPSTSKTEDTPLDIHNPEAEGGNEWANRSFRRSPSYTHAISCDTDTGSQKGKPNRVRYYDGKYYVGVSDDDQMESSF